VLVYFKEEKMSQTTIQKENTIIFGSGKFEISKDGIDWINLGAMNNIVFTETWEDVLVDSDNAGRIKTGIKNQEASLAGDMLEIDLEKLSILRGDLDKYSKDPGISETLKSGGKTTIAARQVKVTNTDESNRIFRITLIKATTAKGIELSFNPDEADDANSVNIEMKGTKDVDKAAGEQLFEIYSERGEAVAS